MAKLIVFVALFLALALSPASAADDAACATSSSKIAQNAITCINVDEKAYATCFCSKDTWTQINTIKEKKCSDIGGGVLGNTTATECKAAATKFNLPALASAPRNGASLVLVFLGVIGVCAMLI